MTRLTTAKKKRYTVFLGEEVLLTIVSLGAAWLIAIYLYPFAPGIWSFIGSLLPQPLVLNGYAVAYAVGAGFVWLLSNTLLFASGLRRL